MDGIIGEERLKQKMTFRHALRTLIEYNNDNYVDIEEYTPIFCISKKTLRKGKR